ncbi:hypothetical protein GP2143_16136 [marine gamma proteobacterium HTCC2143]|uniref:Uncharacterized protein n=1 Tax=marine gamma proteobacterium HTCC2143 TaxID=247633 RepID=A0Y9J7_9GAMM|nr:hypothetical protein GP2143_16136 [marine gamma proteobacterium HTCC2143]
MFRNNATPLRSPAMAIDVCTLLGEKTQGQRAGLGLGVAVKVKGIG